MAPKGNFFSRSCRRYGFTRSPTASGAPVKAKVVEARRPRSFPLFAWGVVLVLTGLMLLRPSPVSEQQEDRSVETMAERVIEIQSKCIVATSQLLGEAESKSFYEDSQALNTGGIGIRLRFAILAGELVGSEETIKQLVKIESLLGGESLKATKREWTMLSLLQRLCSDYAESDGNSEALTAGEAGWLRDLGWFGWLALNRWSGC